MANHAEPLVVTRLEDRGEAGRVASVLVNNPEKRNALGQHGKDELIAAFERLARDPHLRVVVLTGAGDRSFIGGADLAEMAGLDRAGAEIVSTKTHLACDAIRRLPVPVIARVNGYCLGAGMEIAASCDMRVGVETARFGMPEVKFGIPSGMEACLLPGLIGWGKTRELVFTGEMIDAQEAYRIGLANKVVPQAELLAESEKMVRGIMANAPLAVALSIEALDRGVDMNLDDASLLEANLFGLLASSQDMKEGLTAFLEKRPATFTGR